MCIELISHSYQKKKKENMAFNWNVISNKERKKD